MTNEQLQQAIAMHDKSGLSWVFIANYFHTNTTTLREQLKSYEKTNQRIHSTS